MADQIYIGNFGKGLKLDRLPFNIDNDAFPTLYNMYCWRGRAKRKRGTALLGQLQRQITSVAIPTNPWEFSSLSLSSDSGNLITGPWTQGVYSTSVSIESTAAIVPGSLELVVGANTYTEPPTPDGTLIGNPSGSGTINYSNGDITILGAGAGPVTGTFSYYPQVPVLGLEDFISNTSQSEFPLLQAFDTTYSYQINQSSNPFFYSTSYYKGTNNPLVWSNDDYAQFWSTNYQNAFWVSNNKPGFHYVNATYSSGSGTTNITFNFKRDGNDFTTLVVGDVIWFNEWTGSTINTLNGTISSVAAAASGNYVVTFTSSQTVSGTGIGVLLTNSISGQDGIRWYDGDPTNGTGIPTGSGLGWVNFSPPLTALTVSIDDQNAAKYYLVGALGIMPFKDRLLFLGPQIQSVGGPVIQQSIQDMIIWSWNGTPYYNSLVPTSASVSESYDARAFYVDQTGFGGYLPAGISKPITTFVDNEDVIIVGFGGTGKRARFISTGNDLQPFLFYTINSEYPAASTFSAITFNEGGVDIGSYGITATSQQSCERIDLDIPDIIFDIQALNNGQKRVNSARDFYREWIYFSYPTGTGSSGQDSWVYPDQTLLWNYRDNTWAVFRENFTHHGTYRKATYFTWDTLPFKTWDEWRIPWNDGTQVALYPSVIAGNPQGYVLIKDEGTGESISGSILSISDNGVGKTRITSTNHCVNIGDYLYISQCIGSTYLNTEIGLVTEVIAAS